MSIFTVALRGIFYIYNYHEVRQVFREQNGSGSVYKPISSPNDLISFINYIWGILKRNDLVKVTGKKNTSRLSLSLKFIRGECRN